LSNQFSEGKSEPGNVSRIIDRINEARAAIKKRLVFVKSFFAIINDNLKRREIKTVFRCKNPF
jgi:hypothetical protein